MPDDFTNKEVVFRSSNPAMISVGTVSFDGDSSAIGLSYVFPLGKMPARPRQGAVLFMQLDNKAKPRLMALFSIGPPTLLAAPVVAETDADDQT